LNSVKKALQAFAQDHASSSDKAQVLEQGVDDISAALTRSTAVVFYAFVQQTAYCLMWTTATFGDVFKTGCVCAQ
jgi:hypothetical protein